MHSTAWALLNANYSSTVSEHGMEQDVGTSNILAQGYVAVHPQTTV